MRIWGGLADMTPDMAPIMDGNDPVEGFFMNCGWGYFGFKSCSANGKYMAAFMAEGKLPRYVETLSPAPLRAASAHGRNRGPGELPRIMKRCRNDTSGNSSSVAT
jgi:sarcosine oxidase subunit beta